MALVARFPYVLYWQVVRQFYTVLYKFMLFAHVPPDELHGETDCCGFSVYSVARTNKYVHEHKVPRLILKCFLGEDTATQLSVKSIKTCDQQPEILRWDVC